MIRLFFTVLLVTLSLSFEAFAQSQDDGSGRRVYGGERYGAQIYNSTGSSSSYGTSGPLSLKQLLSGKSSTGSSSSSSNSGYYGGSNYRPFGIDNNSHSLSLSPAAIQASRSKRDAFARQAEYDNLRNLQQTARADDLQSETNGFLNKFQSNSPAIATTAKKRTIYKKRNSGFEMPKKVFNSVR